MTEGFSWTELVMPVMVLCLAGVGYLARMTRASMVEVMAQPYIRTALMKGPPRGGSCSSTRSGTR